MAACMDQDIEEATTLIEAGADVNEIVPLSFHTALSYAVEKEDIGVAKLLLEARANPEAKIHFYEEYYESVLQVACANRDREMIELLLDFGADINRKYRDTPLNTAIFAIHEESDLGYIDLLLERKADVNNTGICPPLLGACMIMSIYTPKLVKKLLEAGADVNTKDFLGRTSLTFLQKYGHLEEEGLSPPITDAQLIEAIDLLKSYGAL